MTITPDDGTLQTQIYRKTPGLVSPKVAPSEASRRDIYDIIDRHALELLQSHMSRN